MGVKLAVLYFFFLGEGAQISVNSSCELSSKEMINLTRNKILYGDCISKCSYTGCTHFLRLFLCILEWLIVKRDFFSVDDHEAWAL